MAIATVPTQRGADFAREACLDLRSVTCLMDHDRVHVESLKLRQYRVAGALP